MATIGTRLREVRQQSGLSQAEFGEIGGVQKRAQINYEADERKPDTGYLAAIATAGYDISYIITGVPNPAMAQGLRALNDSVRAARAYAMDHGGRVAEPPQVAYRALTAEEETLLAHYRNADLRGKTSILTTAAALSSGRALGIASSTHVSADHGAVAGGRDVSVGAPRRRSTRRRK